MPKHFDDSLRNPAVTSAASYAVLRDWDALPAVYASECTRFIPYVADGMQGLVEWVDGPELREAIDDGVEREGQYPTLEGEPFNGSILEVVDVHGACGDDFAGHGPIVVERFHVSDPLEEEFDAWMAEEGRRRAAAWPGAVRVRTFRAAPGVPQQWPYSRYQGKGNRMIWVDFGEGVDARKVATDTHVLESLSGSTRWDTRVTYAVRDVGECLLVRTKADIGT
jgi:hypothetical protein